MKYGVKSSASSEAVIVRQNIASKLRQSEIPDAELLQNLGLYMDRMSFSRYMLIQTLYEKIVNVSGSILEFGVRWGQNMALFNIMRGIYEPYNYTRKVIGFDTFSGFVSVEDGKDSANVHSGDYNVAEGWKTTLEELLAFHETQSPLPHIRKWELVEGDATITFPEYLDTHPELIVAMAYFDFDVYSPTKRCLELILPRLTKGSLLVFDELNCPEFPGETTALQEVLGTSNIALSRDPHNPYVAWAVWGA